LNKGDEQLAEQRRLDADYWNTRFVQYDTQARMALEEFGGDRPQAHAPSSRT